MLLILSCSLTGTLQSCQGQYPPQAPWSNWGPPQFPAFCFCAKYAMWIVHCRALCSKDSTHGRMLNTMIIIANINNPVFNTPFNHPPIPHWENKPSNPKKLPTSSVSFCTSFRSCWILWDTDTKWPDRFTQRTLLRFSQLWPWANNRKSIAALFYSIAWHIAISSNNPERTCDVALLCVLSQHPSWPIAFASINHMFILGCDGTHIATTTLRRLQQAMTLPM